jgi:uncharacterized protein (DUF4415 family)
MKKGNSKPLTPELAAELKALEAMPDTAIDTRDIPEVADWRGAERGRFYRPLKVQKTLRLDADVVDYFARQGAGYQTRMNQVLRSWMLTHPEAVGARKGEPETESG